MSRAAILQCNVSEYLYVLSNPSFPGRLKVGWTVDVEARISQLFTTGVPTPFVVEFVAVVEAGREAERLAHRALAQHRVADNREFFAVSVDVAVLAIASNIGPHSVHADRQGSIQRAQEERTKAAIAELEGLIGHLSGVAAGLKGQLLKLRTKVIAAGEMVSISRKNLAYAQRQLELLGARPLRTALTLAERWSGRSKLYEAAYADLIKPWMVAEADVKSVEGELASRTGEHLRLLQEARITDAKLQSELDAINKDIGAAASKLRVLRGGSGRLITPEG